MTVTAFARHVGVDEAAIRKGIKSGRLERTIMRDRKGRVSIPDAAAAAAEWNTTRDPAKVRSEKGERPRQPGLIAQARGRLVNAQARREEIRNLVSEGRYVLRDLRDAQESQRIVTARTKLQGVPTRAKQRLPHLTVADVAVLDSLIREVCEELASTERPEVEAAG
jgi:phage terminase Nu1 subunit (DNA packaging protein)